MGWRLLKLGLRSGNRLEIGMGMGVNARLGGESYARQGNTRQALCFRGIFPAAVS